MKTAQEQIDELKEKIRKKDLAFGLLYGQFVEANASCPPCFQKTLNALADDLFGGDLIREAFAEIVNKQGEGH